jgi:ribosomal protein S17E
VDALDYDKLCATTMENMKSNIKNTKVMESFLEVCTDNEEINSILREVRAYMNPDNKLIEINPENIKELCYRNHKELMECSYSDIDSIKVLLYENRGLATYMKENDEKLAEEYLDKLSSDFDLYKNLIAEAGEPDLHNLKGFAKYYANRLANYDFKYDGFTNSIT